VAYWVASNSLVFYSEQTFFSGAKNLTPDEKLKTWGKNKIWFNKDFLSNAIHP